MNHFIKVYFSIVELIDVLLHRDNEIFFIKDDISIFTRRSLSIQTVDIYTSKKKSKSLFEIQTTGIKIMFF
jgi:hypothetical protein